jgi:hypothetical protein
MWAEGRAMSTANATVQTQTPTKADRKVMGHLTAPIAATKVYSKGGDASKFNGKEPVSFLIFTPENKVVRATTYGGNLGKGFNLGDHNTSDVPTSDKDLKHMMKGYSDVTGTPPAFVALTNELPQDQAA